MNERNSDPRVRMNDTPLRLNRVVCEPNLVRAVGELVATQDPPLIAFHSAGVRFAGPEAFQTPLQREIFALAEIVSDIVRMLNVFDQEPYGRSRPD